MIQEREALALTEYRPQGMAHILKLCAITTAGMVLVSAGGSILFAAPLALATVYGMFRGASKAQDPGWCEARDEIWHYKLSPKHRSIADDYSNWCREWGTHTVNQLIEPMIGNCAIANFTRDKKHPYHSLRGILIYDHDDDDLPPLTPYDYVCCRLKEREEVLKKQESEAIDVAAQAVPLDALTGTPTALTSNPKSTIKFLQSLTQAPLQPVIIAGLPGSGKGILAALSLSLGVQDNKLRFWVFNCKPKLAEAGYWIKAERHYLKDKLQEDESFFSDLMTVLDEFAAEGTRRNNEPGEHQPFVLLLEEVNALTNAFTTEQRRQYKAKVTSLASLLRGCNMAIWMSGQSVTLEDLGLTGKSNRSMFTALVAVSTNNRDSTGVICKPLGIPFENFQLKPNTRYWLTSSGYSEAIQAKSNVAEFPNWESVPNLIDLRSGALPAIHDSHDVENLLTDVNVSALELKKLQRGLQLRDKDVAEIGKQRLEDSDKSNAPNEIAIAQPARKINFELDDILPKLRPIVDLSIKRDGWIKAIDVKRNVRAFKDVSTEVIREHFIILSNQGCGSHRGDGDFLKYSAFEECDEE